MIYIWRVEADVGFLDPIEPEEKNRMGFRRPQPVEIPLQGDNAARLWTGWRIARHIEGAIVPIVAVGGNLRSSTDAQRERGQSPSNPSANPHAGF